MQDRAEELIHGNAELRGGTGCTTEEESCGGEGYKRDGRDKRWAEIEEHGDPTGGENESGDSTRPPLDDLVRERAPRMRCGDVPLAFDVSVARTIQAKAEA